MVIILYPKIISVNILFHAKITKKRKRLSNSSIKIDYDFLSVNKDQSDGCWVMGVEYWVIMFTYVRSLCVCGIISETYFIAPNIGRTRKEIIPIS